jgi:hypothetical protein
VPLTYPAPPPTVSGDTVSISYLLKTPSILARRIRTLLDGRYIADFLLKGRYTATGGGILYETGEPIVTSAVPESIAPGGAYPQVTAGTGALSTARSAKWGQDVPVTDEAVTRLGIDPVNRALNKLSNQSVIFVDSAALAVIASQVTTNFDVTAAGGAWTTGVQAIIRSIETAKAQIIGLEQGYDPDVIAMTGSQWAWTMSIFAAAGLLPREQGNPLLTGEWPNLLGVTWVWSPHTPAAAPILLDTNSLGGMADEKIESPGYASTGPQGVEVKSIRDEDNDLYNVRARRVTVPVVVEPAAGVFLTNTGVS